MQKNYKNRFKKYFKKNWYKIFWKKKGGVKQIWSLFRDRHTHTSPLYIDRHHHHRTFCTIETIKILINMIKMITMVTMTRPSAQPRWSSPTLPLRLELCLSSPLSRFFVISIFFLFFLIILLRSQISDLIDIYQS